MIKGSLHTLGLCGWVFLSSCASTLVKSGADRIMRLEGSYTCEKVSQEPRGLKESIAQADVSRVRCAQDSWAIWDNEVVYTRSLYQSKDCTGPLGKIEFTEPSQRLPDGVRVVSPKCKVVRTNVSWLGERGGECLLKDLALNRPYAVSAKCHDFLPEFCKGQVELKAEPSELEGGKREPISTVFYQLPSSSTPRACKRYVKDL